MTTYKTTASDEHERDEELAWAGLLEQSQVPAGAKMSLIFIQKLCTAFHEIGPIINNQLIEENGLDFIRCRLANRMEKVLDTMNVNQLGELGGVGDLSRLLNQTRGASCLRDLAALVEPVHAVNHRLCDAIARRFMEGPS